MAKWFRLLEISALNHLSAVDLSLAWDTCETIRILHECEVLIYKSFPRVTVWHHEAPRSGAKL